MAVAVSQLCPCPSSGRLAPSREDASASLILRADRAVAQWPHVAFLCLGARVGVLERAPLYTVPGTQIVLLGTR